MILRAHLYIKNDIRLVSSICLDALKSFTPFVAVQTMQYKWMLFIIAVVVAVDVVAVDVVAAVDVVVAVVGSSNMFVAGQFSNQINK